MPTSEQQGVADYIQPDDYISVIATVDANGKVASMTVFTNAARDPRRTPRLRA